MSSVVRIPDEIHRETKRIASIRGQQQGDLLAAAWREYLQNNREAFAADLEEAARVLRDGTLEDVAAFASRNVSARAEAAVEQACAES